MIRLTNLVKRYGDRDVVRGVSAVIQPGEMTGFLGPNGAGKSTTMKMIAGLVRPTSGSVEVCGCDVQLAPLDARRRLGYVPENSALYETLTPHEYLSLVAELYELVPAVARERIGQLLSAFEIQDAANRQIEALSKGMRQKVLIAGALLHDPDVVLLDEPFNGLDVNAALTFRKLLQGMAARGKTVLFSSHMLDVVERLCTRVLIVHGGEVIADGAPQTLMAGAGRGTLEEVFQKLTRREGVEEGLQQFLAALETRAAAPTAT